MRQQVISPAGMNNPASGSQIYVFHAGTSVQVADTLYADGSSSSTLANPYSHPGGRVVFYLPRSLAVDVGVKPAGAASPAITHTVAAPTQVAQYSLQKMGSSPVAWIRQ